MTKKEWTIIGVLGATVVVVLVCLGGVMLTMLPNTSLPQVSMPMTPTPVLDCKDLYFLHLFDDRFRAYSKAIGTIKKPIPMSQIQEMENAYGAFIVMPYPDCAAVLREDTRGYMRATIDAIYAMNAGQYNIAVIRSNEANGYASKVVEELSRLYGPTSTTLPTFTLLPTYTPLPTPTAMPTAAIAKASASPTNRPATSVAPTKPAAIPLGQVPKDETLFKTFLQNKYGTIAGKTLAIERVSVNNESDFRSVDIELDIDSGTYVFMKQTRTDALAYGRHLLDDTITFFGGQECSAYVSSLWYAPSLSTWMFGSEWIYVGDYSTYRRGWYVSTTYVKAHFLTGKKSIDVYNYK